MVGGESRKTDSKEATQMGRFFSLRCRSTGIGIRLRALILGWLLALHLRRFADSLKGLEQGRDIGLVSIISHRYGLVLQITDNVFHAFFIGDILHDLIATTLAVDIAGKNDFLLVGSKDHHRHQSH